MFGWVLLFVGGVDRGRCESTLCGHTFCVTYRCAFIAGEWVFRMPYTCLVNYMQVPFKLSTIFTGSIRVIFNKSVGLLNCCFLVDR